MIASIPLDGPTRWGKIIVAVSLLSKVSVNAIMGPARSQHIMRVRHIAVYCIASITGLSSNQIGDIFCRDHSTILNSIRRGREIVDSSPEMASVFNAVWSQFSTTSEESLMEKTK